KLRSARRMRLGLGSRGRVDNSDRERLIPQNRDRPLNDWASARLSTGAGIVLPSVDHALRLCPAGACRACPPIALASRLRRLCRGFGSLLCHVISPVLESSTCHHWRGELAMMAASRLSLVQWRYRGELVHVSSTIRRRRSFPPTADTSSLPWISPSRHCRQSHGKH